MQQPATPFHHRALANRRKEVDTSDSPKGQNQTLQKTGLLPSGIVNSKVAKLLSSMVGSPVRSSLQRGEWQMGVWAWACECKVS